MKNTNNPTDLLSDGTLIVSFDDYEKVRRVLIQHGTQGTLFYADDSEAERTSGTWQRVSPEKYTHSSDYVFQCDQCGETFVGAWNFCANCGARMKKRETLSKLVDDESIII